MGKLRNPFLSSLYRKGLRGNQQVLLLQYLFRLWDYLTTQKGTIRQEEILAMIEKFLLTKGYDVVVVIVVVTS